MSSDDGRSQNLERVKSTRDNSTIEEEATTEQRIVPMEVDEESSVPKDDIAESDAPIDENAESNAPIDDNVESNAPTDDNADIDAPIDENVESNAPTDDNADIDADMDNNAESDVHIGDNAKSDVSIENIAEGSVSIEDNDESSEKKNDNSAEKIKPLVVATSEATDKSQNESGASDEEQQQQQVKEAAESTESTSVENLSTNDDDDKDAGREPKGPKITISKLKAKISPNKSSQSEKLEKRRDSSGSTVTTTKRCYVDLTASTTSAASFQVPPTPSPFRLKIKLGKDRSGEVVSPDDLPTPDGANGFHGFADNEIEDFVNDNFDGFDLKSDFLFKPTIFVSISSKKQGSKGGAMPSAAATGVLKNTDASATPSTVKKSTPKTPRVRFKDVDLEPTSVTKGLPPATPTTPAGSTTPLTSSKKKSGVQRYFEPLYDGWVRSVVFRPNYKDPKCKNKADVYYLPPQQSEGQARNKFKSANELEGHLITTGSMYPLTFFTFKKEVLGAPEGLEVVSYATSLSSAADVAESSPSVEAGRSLGKRVSKPPEKLITEKLNSEAAAAEARSTPKRTIKPPEKLQPESTTTTRVKKSETKVETASPKVDKSGLWKDPENIVQSPKKSVTTSNSAKGPGHGLLKVKMFSMLNAKGADSPAAKDNLNVVDDNIATADEDIVDLGDDDDDDLAEKQLVIHEPANRRPPFNKMPKGEYYAQLCTGREPVPCLTEIFVQGTFGTQY